jgi:hypothetical protein
MSEQYNIQNKKKFDFRNVIVIVLTLVLAALVVMYMKEKDEHEEIVVQINNEKDSIKVELSKMLVNYDSVKTNNEKLNQNLLMTQSEIKNLLNQVEQVKQASYEEVSQYRNKVTTLRGIMKDLYNQIDSLNERNKILYAENIEVKKQISDEKNKNEQLVKEKDELVQTVKKAQILDALDLKVTGLTTRDKVSDRASKTQKLMVGFSLSKNLTTPRGLKNIYVRIMKPDQLLLVNNEGGVFNFEDLTIPYSASREINYEGNELPVNIYWDNTGHEPLIPGTYTIDVFADGYNIGTTTFLLKK